MLIDLSKRAMVVGGVVTPSQSSAVPSDLSFLGKSSRLTDEEYQAYKWHENTNDALLYNDIINYKRSSRCV